MSLNPNFVLFTLYFQSKYIIWLKIEKELGESIKSLNKTMNLSSCDVLVHSRVIRDLEPNLFVTSVGEASFFAFEMIMLLAGLHLKFLALKSL